MSRMNYKAYSLIPVLFFACVPLSHAVLIEPVVNAPNTHELIGIVEAKQSPLRNWYRAKSEGCVQIFVRCKKDSSARECIEVYQSCQVKYYEQYQRYRREGVSESELH